MGALWDHLSSKLKEYPEQKISENDICISYSDLYEKALALSKKLQKNKKYGILCNSELNSAIGILACFAAGAVAVPLSARYGENHRNKIIESIRLSEMITDSGVSRISERFSEHEYICNTAIIMCTSGTTGNPKGVQLSENNILRNLQSIQAYFKLSADDRILILRSLFHISALTGEFLLSLCVGAEIVIFGTVSLPIAAAKVVVDKNIGVLCATPTLLNQLCDIFPRMGCQIPLRKVAISGECLNKAVADKLLAALPDTLFYNVYGLTEAAPRVSALLPEDFAKRPESVGKPIKDVKIKITNGELLVRGPNVMQGYYLNPEATAEKLKDGWLHTGDIAHIDENGFLYIKGRADDMIIRAGINIYPQEIENALMSNPEVREALVLERDGKIVAKIVGNISKKEALDTCLSVLAPYALPDSFEFVNTLPKNATGKLVRHD